MREGIANLIRACPDLEVCGEATAASEAFDKVPALKPDLIVLDLSLPDKNGLELLKDFNILCPDTPVLVLSMHDEILYAERVIRAGGRGYLMKDSGPKKLIAAIEMILKGGMAFSESIAAHILGSISGKRNQRHRSPLERLTDREMEVFELVGLGKGAHQIAAQLHISPRTVDAHRAHIREKLGLPDSPALMRYAVRWVETNSSDSLPDSAQ
jgi:DNA-binding NarL/FixJ family response regulator